MMIFNKGEMMIEIIDVWFGGNLIGVFCWGYSVVVFMCIYFFFLLEINKIILEVFFVYLLYYDFVSFCLV